VHAIRLRGHSSDSNPAYCSIADYVADVEALVKTLPNGPPILMGHSMGGFITQKCLEKFPVKMAILVASVPPYGMLKMIWEKWPFYKPFFSPVGIVKAWINGYDDFPGDLRTNCFPADKILFPDEKVEEARKNLVHESCRIVEGFISGVNAKLVPKNVPVFVIGAEDDFIISQNAIKNTAAFHHTTPKFYKTTHNIMEIEPVCYQFVGDVKTWIKSKL